MTSPMTLFGRLVGADIPGHVLSYGFDEATCGPSTLAGCNGNRTFP